MRQAKVPEQMKNLASAGPSDWAKIREATQDADDLAIHAAVTEAIEEVENKPKKKWALTKKEFAERHNAICQNANTWGIPGGSPGEGAPPACEEGQVQEAQRQVHDRAGEDQAPRDTKAKASEQRKAKARARQRTRRASTVGRNEQLQINAERERKEQYVVRAKASDKGRKEKAPRKGGTCGTPNPEGVRRGGAQRTAKVSTHEHAAAF